MEKITLHRFERFKDTAIDLQERLSLVVGGNNSGTSSSLQALATWQLCKTLMKRYEVEFLSLTLEDLCLKPN